MISIVGRNIGATELMANLHLNLDIKDGGVRRPSVFLRVADRVAGVSHLDRSVRFLKESTWYSQQ